MATTPNFSQPAIFSEVSTPTAPDSGYLKVYANSGTLCSIANGGSEKAYVTSSDLSAYLPLAGGTLVGDLKFTDATYDIGKSGATRPRDGFFSRGLGVGNGVNGVYFWAAGTNTRDMYISNAIGGSEPQCVIHRADGISIGSANGAGAVNFYNDSAVVGTLWGTIRFDSANVFSQRNSTNAQTFRIYSTYTSSTSFESLTFAPTTSAINIGLQVGSAGGTNTRNINFGHWDTSGTFITRFTSAASVTQAISDTTCVFRLYGHGAVATGTQIQCYKARGTDRNTKLYPVSGDIFGGLNCYGYDENAANWSTSKGAYIITASGNWTSTANGTQHTWQVTNSSDATKTLTTAMTLTTDGSLNPLCGINSSKLIRQNAEVSYTPTGPTQTITLNDGNHQTLNLTSATGAVTVTLTVPTSSSAGTIIVNQHASAAKDLTWAVSSGTIRWMGAEPDWAADAISSDRLVSWRWNGTIMRLVATDVGT